MRRVGIPTQAAALTSAVAATAINFATEWKTSLLTWIGAAVLTVLSGVVSYVLWKRQNEAQAEAGGAGADGVNDIDIRGDASVRNGHVVGRTNRWRSGTLRAETMVFEAGAQATTPSEKPAAPPVPALDDPPDPPTP